MDPTFGGQELLDSLSQASASGKSRQSKESKASKGGGGGGHSRGGNSSNSSLTSAPTNTVEDAYRRIGQGLSQRAQGEDDGRPRLRARLGAHPNSSFLRYERPNKKPFNPHDAVGGHPVPPQGGPSPKIAKTGIAGHFHEAQGDSGANSSRKPSQRCLKQITVHAKESFHKWKRQQKAGYLNKYSSNTLSTSATSAATSSTAGASYQQLYDRKFSGGLSHGSHDTTSPQRHAFSQLALQHEQSVQLQQQQQQQQLLMQQQQSAYLRGQGGTTNGQPPPKGLLSAVLEGGSESTFENESVHSLPTISSQTAGLSKSSSIRTASSGANLYHQYPGPSSLGRGYHQTNNMQTPNSPSTPALHFGTPRGPCLTQPAAPVSNDGLDNSEGNIILHQSDILVVPSQGKGGQSRSNSDRGLEFHVQSLLGQGTFAQVFSCWESTSKKHVALKIIKNKPAFTKQAAIEIEIFQALAKPSKDPAANMGGSPPNSPHMVQLISSFMYKSHLCLVFEQLGMNLYEVLKRRQFRGLPLAMVRTLVRQAIEGVKGLGSKGIVHCDLKPENILIVDEEVEKEVVGAGERSAQPKEKEFSSAMSVTSVSSTTDKISQTIKLIDFGSACFEGYSAHTYIQSRFYRSPEVLMGLPYDSAIDMWSLGCVAAELFLGLPILPGVHEHDQCGRIVEMIGAIPDWMLEQGSKSTKYYVKYVPRSPNNNSNSTGNGSSARVQPSQGFERPMAPQWRMKTQTEYINSLTDNEIRKKGGLDKLKKQPANRYFKRTKLSDIIMLHGQHCTGDEKELLGMFVHFLYGILDPDPWKRWTAFQASQHPFLKGVSGQLRKKTDDTRLDHKEENQANLLFDVFWVPPWDPGICRRKLLSVQKMREKQNAQRRGFAPRGHGMDGQDNNVGPDRMKQQSPSMNSRAQPMMVADSPSVGHMSVDGRTSPPSGIALQNARNAANQRNSAMSVASLPRQQASAQASSLSDVSSSIFQSTLATEGPNRQHVLNAPPHSDSRILPGPQSYTSLGFEHQHRKPVEGDFGYALQRPGNNPALNSDATTVASQQSMLSMGSLTSSQGLAASQHQAYGYNMSQSQSSLLSLNSPMDRGGRTYSGTNQSNNVSSLPNAAGRANQRHNMLSAGGVSYQGGYGNGGNSHEQPGGLQYLAQQQQQRRANELQQRGNMNPQVMTEYHHQLLLQEQQKQLAALQQQHQQQLAALQQQQQLAFQQQQQQYLSQFGPAGNGYYYVTSADGTPMLMQAAGVTNMDNASHVMPPHQQQQQRSFDNDDSGSQGQSMRDNRSRQIPRQRKPGGGGGMSM